MTSLLRWLSDLVGSIYVLQIMWTPIKRLLGMDYESRVDRATADLLARPRSDLPDVPLEPVFRFVGNAPSAGGITALFVNEGAGVTSLTLERHGGSAQLSERLESGASGRIDLEVPRQPHDVSFELAYTDAAGVRQSQPFVFRADEARVEAIDVLAPD